MTTPWELWDEVLTAIENIYHRPQYEPVLDRKMAAAGEFE